MQHDIEGIIRQVSGFSKQSDEDGDRVLEVEYELGPIPLAFLRKIFKRTSFNKLPLQAYVS